MIIDDELDPELDDFLDLSDFDHSLESFEIDQYEEAEEEDDNSEEKEPREDKIFNNRYNTGEGLDENEQYQFTKNISVSNDYSDAYLKDLYDYENELDLKVVLDYIFKMFGEDPEISKIFQISSANFNAKKLKVSKEDINFVFNRIHDTITKNSHGIIFYSPIYILEVISSVASIEYRKIFDMLNTENQEILLLELNEKYLFLDGKMNKKRIH
jgi:hypothetical protein